jgi:hypothetical protein
MSSNGGGGGGGDGDVVILGSGGGASSDRLAYGGVAANFGPGRGGSNTARGALCESGQGGKVVVHDGTPEDAYGGSGYFVLTFGERSMTELASAPDAADALCLNDLSNGDWNGKQDATARGLLEADFVRAFVCRPEGCPRLDARTAYRFATAGLPAVGGDGFVTDEAGLGPNDVRPWNAFQKFGSNPGLEGPFYWTGRAASGEIAAWTEDPEVECATGTAAFGDASGAHQLRWGNQSASCGDSLRILCAVSPSPAR